LLAAKESKMAHAVSAMLHCPTLVAIQEVEHVDLLEAMADRLEPACGFRYTVSHAESADARGIDNGLLSDPRRVMIRSVVPQQVCSPVPTDHVDATIVCAAGESVLFDRPPLQVDMTLDGRPAVVFVNHFKSKREGEAETALERLAQARFQNALAADLLAADPTLPILVMGDLNDYELSAPILTLTDPAQGGQLLNALSGVPEPERYSYVFGGVAGLLDAVLVSPALHDDLAAAGILHVNTDYPSGWTGELGADRLPYRFSDHDIPWIVWPKALPVAPIVTPLPEATSPPATEAPPTAEPSATATPEQVALVATEAATITSPPVATSTAAAKQPPLWPWIVGALIVAAVGGLLTFRLRR
jgi:endonuclease/exonuclease/phosphatase family metal-dependent hydrolase